MPTAALSSRISDAVYLVSIVVLAVFLARPVGLVYAAAEARGATIVASSVGGMIDSMSPGSTFVMSLQTYPGVHLSVTLSGSTVTAAIGRSTATSQVRWPLQGEVLSPGETYNFTFRGGEIAVAPVGHG